MEIQVMGQLLSLVLSCHNSGRIGGKSRALVLVKVLTKGDDGIILQLSNYFSKAAEHLLHKTEVIYISQEEISSRISEIIDWSLIKLQSLALCTNNIHIFIMMGIQFRHSSITHPVITERILPTVATLTLQVKVVELCETSFFSAHFLPGEV